MTESAPIYNLLVNEFTIGIIFGGAFSIVGSYFSIRFQSRKAEHQMNKNVLILCYSLIEDFVATFKRFDDNVSRLDHFDMHSIKIMDNIVYRFETFHREYLIHIKDIKLRKDIVNFFREININLADLKDKLERREENKNDFYVTMIYGAEVASSKSFTDASRQNYESIHQAE